MKFTVWAGQDYYGGDNGEAVEWLRTLGFELEFRKDNRASWVIRGKNVVEVEIESLEKLLEMVSAVEKFELGVVIIRTEEPVFEIFNGYLE